MSDARVARMERVAAIASMACAVHCAIVPVLVAAGAAGAFSWFQNEPVEWGLVLFAGVVGTVSAWRGFRTHGNVPVATVLAIAALSLVLLTFSHHGEHAAEGHNHALQWLAPIAGIALGVALLVNRRLCGRCKGCPKHAA